MLGSSSTTSRRASGVLRLRSAGHVPPVARAGAVVWDPSVAAPAAAGLDATCETGRRPVGRSGSRGHGPAPPPVADRVVLGPAQPPAAAQVGPDARTAADSAATQAKTSSPSGRSSPATASASRVLSPGGMAPRCSQRTETPPERPAAAPRRRRPPRPAPSPRRWVRPAARIRLIAGSAVSSPARSRCPAGAHPAAPPPAEPSGAPGAAAAAQAAAGPSPCSTKSISTSPATGSCRRAV